ncbi:hypothetical protein [Pseudomonas veronii]
MKPETTHRLRLELIKAQKSTIGSKPSNGKAQQYQHLDWTKDAQETGLQL